MLAIKLGVLTLCAYVASAAEEYEGFTYIGSFTPEPTERKASAQSAGYWMSTSALDWGSAFQNCSLLVAGSNLMTIDSADEDNAVRTMMLAAYVTTAWSAGAYHPRTGAYRWITTGSGFREENVFPKHWGDYVPTDPWITWATGCPVFSYNQRLYVENSLFPPSVWHTADVGTELRYICEKAI